MTPNISLDVQNSVWTFKHFFCGMFPIDTAEFSALREALEKLSLNDSSFSFEAETSAALGFGFRCGFLGLLHMEVITERLSRDERQGGRSVDQSSGLISSQKGRSVEISYVSKLETRGVCCSFFWHKTRRRIF